MLGGVLRTMVWINVNHFHTYWGLDLFWWDTRTSNPWPHSTTTALNSVGVEKSGNDHQKRKTRTSNLFSNFPKFWGKKEDAKSLDGPPMNNTCGSLIQYWWPSLSLGDLRLVPLMFYQICMKHVLFPSATSLRSHYACVMFCGVRSEPRLRQIGRKSEGWWEKWAV